MARAGAGRFTAGLRRRVGGVGDLARRVPGGRSPRGRSAAALMVSLGVHAVVLGLLALALRGVVYSGSGTVVSLDLGDGAGEGETFALAPAIEMDDSPEVPELPDEEQPSDRIASASSGLRAALDRVASAPSASVEAAPFDRGGGSSMGGEPLLDRGGSGGPLAGLRESTAVPALDGASFAGVSAQRASSVVYAVDASGAMVTSLPFVLDELRRSVSALAADQTFAVVLFGRRAGEDDAAAGTRVFPPEGLLPATPRRKAELFAWLDGVQARGISNPLDGLLVAIERKPEVVFLLSRSIRRTEGGGERAGDWGPGREAILQELDAANPVRKSIFGPPARAVQVKCVQFLEEDPTGVMRAIARVHGGGSDGQDSYRLLPESELRRR
ncbi:MAG: hypothetical protein ACIAS6_14020 [Phycisphaerales bacterium JB060]